MERRRDDQLIRAALALAEEASDFKTFRARYYALATVARPSRTLTNSSLQAEGLSLFGHSDSLIRRSGNFMERATISAHCAASVPIRIAGKTVQATLILGEGMENADRSCDAETSAGHEVLVRLQPTCESAHLRGPE